MLPRATFSTFLLSSMNHGLALCVGGPGENSNIFPPHFPRAEMFALRRSDENETEREILPARFASRVEHRLVTL